MDVFSFSHITMFVLSTICPRDTTIQAITNWRPSLFSTVASAGRRPKMGLHERGILSYGLGPQTCSYNRDRHFGRPDQRCDCKCWSRLLRPRLCTLAWKPHAAKGRTMCSSLHLGPVASARSQISIWNLWDAANGDAL